MLLKIDTDSPEKYAKKCIVNYKYVLFSLIFVQIKVILKKLSRKVNFSN